MMNVLFAVINCIVVAWAVASFAAYVMSSQYMNEHGLLRSMRSACVTPFLLLKLLFSAMIEAKKRSDR